MANMDRNYQKKEEKNCRKKFFYSRRMDSSGRSQRSVYLFSTNKIFWLIHRLIFKNKNMELAGKVNEMICNRSVFYFLISVFEFWCNLARNW